MQRIANDFREIELYYIVEYAKPTLSMHNSILTRSSIFNYQPISQTSLTTLCIQRNLLIHLIQLFSNQVATVYIFQCLDIRLANQ